MNKTASQLRFELNSLALQSPSLPNLSARFAITFHRLLVEGKSSPKGAWVCNIFDRVPPWIKPSFTKGFLGDRDKVFQQSCTWLKTANVRAFEMAEKVNAAIVRVEPFQA